MILEQLTVHNFCLFRGQQILDLSPGQRNGKRRPIVLFGGINGGGKATLFDAVQLALRGPRRARCGRPSPAVATRRSYDCSTSSRPSICAGARSPASWTS